MTVFAIGPDTITLVKRTLVLDEDEAQVYDSNRVPARTETRIDKTGCSWAEHPATEEIAGTQVAVIKAVGHLVVDADTETLAATDAVEYRGRLFEMQGPGVRRDDLDGNPDHVRAEAIWADDVSLGEQVVIIPAGGRDLDGNYAATGTAVPVTARAVTAGNTLQRFGAAGSALAADFTVVLDIDTPISDGDWIEVRGHTCRALITAQLSQWQDRNQLVVLARTAGAAN